MKAWLVFLICTFGTLSFSKETASLQLMSLEELMGVSVSTGSFLELNLNKSPLSMTIISEKHIKISGARHLSELLEIYVPGFQYMINKWNGTVWGMRGISGDRNDNIIVLINGRKQDIQAFHGAATEYTLGLMADIEQIEVLRGPAGLVYGSGAIGGVINIVTKTRFENSSFGSIQYQSTGKNGIMGRAYEGGLYAILQDHHTLALHGGYRTNKGLGENSAKNFGHYELLLGRTTPHSGDYTAGSPHSTSGNFLGSIDYSVGNFNSYARYTRQQDDMAAYYYPSPWKTSPITGSETWIKGHSYIFDSTSNYHFGWTPHRKSHIRDNVTLALQYEWYIGEDNLRVISHFAGVTNRLINVAEVDIEESTTYTSGERRYELGFIYLMKRLSSFQWAFGGDIGYDDIGDDLENRNEDWYWSPENDRMEVRKRITPIIYKKGALYWEGEYTFSDRLSFTTGLRFDTHTRTTAQYNPKVAVVYNPHDHHSFKLITQSSSNNADALTYELPPNQRDRGWSYDIASPYGKGADSIGLDSLKKQMGSLVPPISQEELHNIKPERSYSFELATTHLFLQKLKVGSSFSYNMIRNLFTWNSVLARNMNLGEYDALVLELEGLYNHSKVSIGGDISYQRPLNFDNSKTTFVYPKFVPKWDSIQEEWFPYDTLPSGEYVGDTAIIREIMSTQVSADGKYFNNLHTLSTKLFVDFHPFDYLTLHSDARFFWGLWGRSPIHQEYIAASGGDYNFLNMANLDGSLFDGYVPMTKLNLSLHFHLPQECDIGLFAYDLLGSVDNRHAVRWQQLSKREQNEYYTVDQRSFAVKISKKF